MVRRLLWAVLLAGCAAPTIPVRTLPPIPDSVSTQLGWIRVERVPAPTCGDSETDGTTTLGCFSHRSRRIQVATDLSLAQAWETLEHEKVHVRFWDGAVQVPEEVEERIADVIGAARVAEMLSSRGSP